jgi:uncharacterized protein (TIRG00374 family)
MKSQSATFAFPQSQPRSWWKTGLKAVAVIALLVVLGMKGFISIDKTRRALTDVDHVLPAIGFAFIALCLGVIRWQWLLRAQGIKLPMLRTLEFTLIGNFFNIALPGAVSGDVVKAFYIGREVEGKRGRSFGAILFDRVVGLSALVMVSAGALSIGRGSFHGTGLIHGIRAIMILAALGVVSFYSYLFVVRENHDPLLKFMRQMEKRTPKFGSITRIYEGIRHYHHHPATVAGVLAISVVIHLLIGCACLWFARALGDVSVPLLSIYVIVPLGLLVTAVPVAPAGIGTGHAAFLFLFGLIGSQVGPDVFSLYALSQVLFAAFGGFVYMRFKGKN